GGLIKADSGEIAIAKGRRVGYLTQDPDLDPKETLRSEAERAFAELHRLHQQLDQVFEAMAEADGDELEKLMKKQSRLEEQVEAAGGYAIDHKIDAVLHGLGFTDGQFAVAVEQLSGGQKARLALAKLLLEGPDVLLLDEPTNHLDLDGRLWLEGFLRDEYQGAVLVISHDRYLLDHVVTRIVEVEHGRTIDYPGNYAKFRKLRVERRENQLRAWESQQAKFKQTEAFIRKYKEGQRAKQARGRQSVLDRQKEGALEKPVELESFNLKFAKPDRSGDRVVTARSLCKQYPLDDGGAKVLFNGLDVSISRGERWGIIGPNGAGKSTLVRTLLGEQDADSGTVKIGSNVMVGYFRQLPTEDDADLPVYRALQRAIVKENPDSEVSEQQARNLAGAFLFSGAEQEKEMRVLSGGERARVRLAALLASAKNLIVLDEPTNHLDIEGAERLEDALRPDSGYEETIILISHDRAMIDAVCDHLIVLDATGGAEIFDGNYTAWHERETTKAAKQAEQQAAAKAHAEREEKKRRAAADKQSHQKKTQKSTAQSANGFTTMSTSKIESRIEEIQTRIAAIDQELGDPDVWSNPKKCDKLGRERTKLSEELEPLEFEWLARADEG
ncbi:MAG: ABC-F family ATP-binding cassette domain-containing protein, partial [Planctomycetota bacterium]